MGLLDKLKELTRPYDDDDDDYEDFTPSKTERIPVEPRTTTTSPRSSASQFAGDRTSYSSGSRDFGDRARERDNKVVNIHTTAQLQVVLVKPERFENAAEIADHLRERRTVVLNLEQTNKDIARRLIDFVSGVAYAHEGKIKKVAVSTYIITPYNVDIMGDLIDELENNGLYF